MKLRRKQKKMLVRIAAAIVLVVALEVTSRLVSINEWLFFALYMIPYLIAGYDVILKSLKGIGHGQLFDENFLMALATVGAIILKDYEEAAAVMIFYQVGELFQSIAVGRSRENISELMDIRPDYANIEADGQLQQVDPNTVEVGTAIIVQPGEKIPLDGIIVSGSSSLNTSALTGESLPQDVEPGDTVNSGCINETGLLRIETTKVFGESTASKILDLVENASSRKSKSENFITKFAKYYTPIVVSLAALIALVPPIVRLIAGTDALWSEWIYRAITILVISCPCAIVVSVPLSFFGGIGGASNAGILIKGSNYMETLARVNEVVFDKTGTITKGNFEVTGIHHNEMESSLLLDLVAHAESYSSHPISKSVQRAYGKPVDQNRVSDVEEISGHGVVAKVDDRTVAVGNAKLMRKLGVEYVDCNSIGTILHIAVNGRYAGHIVISDELKPYAKEAVDELHKSGVRRTVMLTGDTESVAKAVAADIGVDDVHAGLLPADKVALVEQFLAGKGRNEKLAFVGDGINDAPVLSRADIGFAMGGLGSDAAIEAADVVLMDDDPLKISKAIRIARKCIKIVYTNVYFAIGVKTLCLILGALGIANMWLAIFADVGVMVLCVLNAMRCLYVKNV